MPSTPASCHVYAGCYGNGHEPTLHVYKLSMQDGSFEQVQAFSGVAQASWLALHPNQQRLYAVSERGQQAGEEGGAAAFARDPVSGRVSLINQQSSRDPGPAYLAVHPSGRLLVLANYVGGSITMLPVLADGALGQATGHLTYRGSSINIDRQAEPHAHSAVFSPDGRHLFVCDLGTDQLHQYAVQSRGQLQPLHPPTVKAAPGAGPRHLVFHPQLPCAYVTNELANTIAVYAHDPHDGHLTQVQTVAMLPAAYTADSTAADLRVTPDGRYLYASNRGHDSLAGYQIAPDTGHLLPIGHFPCGGKTPRGFTIDPTGRWLLVAHQASHSLLSMRIAWRSGELTPHHYVYLHNPVAVLCAAAAGG